MGYRKIEVESSKFAAPWAGWNVSEISKISKMLHSTWFQKAIGIYRSIVGNVGYFDGSMLAGLTIETEGDGPFSIPDSPQKWGFLEFSPFILARFYAYATRYFIVHKKYFSAFFGGLVSLGLNIARYAIAAVLAIIPILVMSVTHIFTTLAARRYLKAFNDTEFTDDNENTITGAKLYELFQERDARTKCKAVINESGELQLSIDGKVYSHNLNSNEEDLGEEEVREFENNHDNNAEEPLLDKAKKLEPTVVDAAIKLGIFGLDRWVDKLNKKGDANHKWDNAYSNLYQNTAEEEGEFKIERVM